MSLHNLDYLYRQTIMAYAQHPHHYQPMLETENYHIRKYNPTCGDVIDLAFNINNDIVTDTHFYGDGCAISKSSASMMTDLVIGKNISQITQLVDQFSKMVRGEAGNYNALGEAQILSGVTKFPTRIKCATLAWHALAELLAIEK
ncbi:SUF system NifU family Fe-S cluster assembly protein [Leuconostoc falkenbergense]|uniref:SUF system NifU family Fe-S cluster assembly protein n=1 Tax=Leuconostoc falkenbergense TaxID=2766470 RepID=A0ABT7RWA7_9LACO|nr:MULTISPECIES: SUF system NifU family Fe-S cluster assembly protein [Leuconostoc]MDM7645577.1 SUF system NifU family Fe-S cluster assembly protein [Leuconostoc falkenbergense]MDY5163719.1 SUF system NifU family Fe-S cluster assembly protein [Leuconostoc falkenbergense]NLT85554.1 SUF system NifU family Fe-S cluster assembly protein [Leuconostoc sp.]HCU42794.1 SUF system NifU family Fe-S cluster assembly protein [Leuconostoc pseudomesenteroides]